MHFLRRACGVKNYYTAYVVYTDEFSLAVQSRARNDRGVLINSGS